MKEILFALLILSQVVDFFTTYKIIKNRGIERFWITNQLIHKFGLVKGLLISKGVAVLLVVLLWYYDSSYSVILLLMLFYVGILYNNSIILKEQK